MSELLPPDPDLPARPARLARTPAVSAKVQRPPGDRPDWKPGFLRRLERWGAIGKAARGVGVSRAAVYKCRKDHPEFAAAMDEALELFREAIDLLVLKRGREGSDRCLLAKARAELPGKYGKQDPRPATAIQPITVVEIVLDEPTSREPLPGTVASDRPAEAPALPPKPQAVSEVVIED